ncbi:MAG: phage portal protein [Desulfobacterium sp.]
MLKEISKAASRTKLTWLDKTIFHFAPVTGAKRMKARIMTEMLASYTGASKSRRSMKEWSPMGNDADSDILPDLETLRERSRDLIRNNPIANGAIKTKVTNVVGAGLRLQSRIDRKALGMDDDQADVWEEQVEREWRLFWDTKETDVARTLTGHDMVRQVYHQSKENGDVFVLLPRVNRQNCPYDLKLQIIEADRVCNPNNQQDTEKIAGGIERDTYGAPVTYHIMKHHPGSIIQDQKWESRPAYGSKTGLRNVIHLFNPTRPGQSRGVPDLAAVIEPLKQLGRYTEAEMMAAVISGFFTVFIESETGGIDNSGGFNYSNFDDESGQSSSDKDMKLGNGLIIDLAPGEKIHDSNPGRPNAAFDPFFQAILRQVGVGLELPFEILIKHFTASYAAARAALLELWKYVMTERRHLTDNFLKLVYEIWMYEGVATGRLAAPGYLVSPSIRAAYLGSEWIGPAKGQIDELKEAKAADLRMNMGISTLADETAQATGKDWDSNHRQQVKEKKRRLEDGLIEGEVVASASDSPPPPGSEYEDIKGKLDAYGVGIRAGGITSQRDDEISFRDQMDLPTMGTAVEGAWEEDEGFRRPITLSSGQIDVNTEGKEAPIPNDDDPGEE